MSEPVRVVVFGPARSGKTALAEFLHHHTVGRGVRVFDADGRSAGELLTAPALPPGPLSAEVLAADALVLVVDAAADPQVVDQAFAAFADFLRKLEDGRSLGRAVGGLPVVLTLAKCDALSRPGEPPSDWLRRIELRKTEVRKRFEGLFADELAPPADGYLPFGSLELHLAATAKELPAGPGFTAYADPGGTFGVKTLVGVAVPAAAGHRDRAEASSRRLRRTAAGLGGVVLTLLVGLGVLAVAPAADPLAERVRAYQRREGPPAERLAAAALPAVRKELEAVRAAPGFGRLPEELQAFVRDRLREAEAYTLFRERFDPPRLGPAEVRTRQQMETLAADLRGVLAVPPEYAADWADTDAGRLAAKWAADLPLLEAAERELHDRFRNRGRRGDLLLLTETPPDPAWRAAVGRLLEEAPPHAETEPLAGSPTAPGPRGQPLTWAAAFATERVTAAAGDWADTAARLAALREACDAVGLTTPNGPLVGLDREPKTSAARVVPQLPAGDRWRADRFPDPVRGVLAERFAAAFENATRGLRKALPADADRIAADPDWLAWGELLKRLAGWAGRPPVDPVQELIAFLRRDRFAIDLRAVRVTLPDDLTDPPPAPAGPLVIRHNAAELSLPPAGVPTRDRPDTTYTFAGPAVLTLSRGDTLTATLPVRAGAEPRELAWPAGSGPFAFLRLAGPSTINGVPAVGVRLTAPGLTPPVLLADPGGR
jgi:hypothetical protein